MLTSENSIAFHALTRNHLNLILKKCFNSRDLKSVDKTLNMFEAYIITSAKSPIKRNFQQKAGLVVFCIAVGTSQSFYEKTIYRITVGLLCTNKSLQRFF